MTDPADRLARFTPVGPDAAELLIRMGRASAPTPRRWKVAVAGLLLTNAAALGWIALRPEPPVPAPTIVPVVVPVLMPDSPVTDAPRYGVFRVHDDPDTWPPPESFAGVAPPGPPLTPLAARRGDID